MRTIPWGEMCFSAIVAGLLGLWLAFCLTGFPGSYAAPADCRILDIELTKQAQNAQAGNVCRVVIHLNERVKYHVQRTDGGVRVELACHGAAPEVLERRLSNALVRNLWVRSCEEGRMTVGLDLGTSRVRVTNRVEATKDWAIVIELEKRPVPGDLPSPEELAPGQTIARRAASFAPLT